MNKQDLKAILLRHEGRSRAIKSKELAELLQCDERRVRLIIRDLITDGLPVASSTESPAGGYFIPTSVEEAKHCTESLRSRAIEIFLRRKELIRNTALYLKPATQGKFQL